MKFLSLIALRQFLQASGRLMVIVSKSQPWAGFPILSAFLDVLERISQDAHKETVAPALGKLLETIDARCPGVVDGVLAARDRDDLRNGDRIPSPQET